MSDERFRVLLLRKAFHIPLCFLLILPFAIDLTSLLPLSFGTLEYYSLLAVVASVIDAIRLKQPLLRDEVRKTMRRSRERLMDEMLEFIKTFPGGREFGDNLRNFEKWISRFEDSLDNQMDRIERSYERIGGYVGVTHGVIGVLVSYLMFRDYLTYGVAALTIVDPLAALVGTGLHGHRAPRTSGTVEGTLAGFLGYVCFLTFVQGDFLKVLATAILVSLVELYGVEDNLLIPITASFLTKFFNFPILATAG